MSPGIELANPSLEPSLEPLLDHSLDTSLEPSLDHSLNASLEPSLQHILLRARNNKPTTHNAPLKIIMTYSDRIGGKFLS